MIPLVSAWPPDGSQLRGRNWRQVPAPGHSSYSAPAQEQNLNREKLAPSASKKENTKSSFSRTYCSYQKLQSFSSLFDGIRCEKLKFLRKYEKEHLF
jgi:hypothetical protein